LNSDKVWNTHDCKIYRSLPQRTTFGVKKANSLSDKIEARAKLNDTDGGDRGNIKATVQWKKSILPKFITPDIIKKGISIESLILTDLNRRIKSDLVNQELSLCSLKLERVDMELA
jgi:hypothetical protein